MKKGLVFCILLLLFATGKKCFPNNHRFQHYTVNDGLPSSQVYDAIQDGKGYMWFATDRGLSRFDGYDFVNFGLEDGLTDNTILQFFPQPDGSIWCSTFNRKLFSFHPRDYCFEPYQYNDTLQNLNHGFIINGLYIDDNETLVLDFLNKIGFVSIDASGKLTDCINYCELDETHFYYHFIDQQQRNFGFLGSLYLEHTMELSNCSLNVDRICKPSAYVKRSLIAGNHHVHGLINGTVVIYTQDTTISIVSSKAVTGLGEFDSTHFWVSYYGDGVRVFDYRGREYKSLLRDVSVSALYFDHERGLWVTTLNAGVFYISGLDVVTKPTVTGRDEFVTSLAIDRKRNAIYAGYFGGNIVRYTSNNPPFLVSKSELGIRAQVQYSQAFEDVVGMSLNTIHLMTPNERLIRTPTTALLSLSDDTASSTLMVGGSSGFYTYSRSGLFNFFVTGKRVTDVSWYRSAYVIGSLDGLYWFSNDTLTPFHEHELYRSRIEDIDVKGDTLFIGTKGNGLIYFDNDTTYNIGVQHGLYGDLVCEVFVENDSTVWLATNGGANRVQFHARGNYSITGISTKDGLICNDVTDIKIFNDSVWVATREGISVFPVAYMDRPINAPYHYFQFTKVKVNDRIVSSVSLGGLAHYENRLRFEFLAISFRSNTELEYRYRLFGLDSAWHYTTFREATYLSVPSGDYRLDVQARVFGEPWGNSLSYKVKIAFPFYEQWWFLILCAVLFGLIIYFFFYLQIVSYNKDITRELLRQILRRLRKSDKNIVLHEQGNRVKIPSSSVLYVKSLGNYLEIHTEMGKYLMRHTLSKFFKIVPDHIEYARVHRSYIVRLDKVEKKNVKCVTIRGNDIPLGEKYKSEVSSLLI